MKFLLLLLLFVLLPCTEASQSTPLRKALDNYDAQYYRKPMPYPYFAQTGQLAFNLNSPFCSPLAAAEVLLAPRPPIKIQTDQGVQVVKPRILENHNTLNYTHKKGHARRINVGDSLKIMLKNYNFVLTQFVQNGDVILQNRHFCIGFMDVYAPDAKSAAEGIILFDPRIYQLLDEFETNMHSQLMLEMHELAHQLQFIHKMKVTRDPQSGQSGVTDVVGQYLTNDKTIKRFELTADCMAGAMTHLLYPIDASFAAQGLMMAGIAYGDFEVGSPDHHGQPLERAVAVNRGLKLAKQQPNRKWQSGQLMLACEAQIRDIRTLGSIIK